MLNKNYIQLSKNFQISIKNNINLLIQIQFIIFLEKLKN